MAKWYNDSPAGCPFCAIDKTVILACNELAFAIRDSRPVTPLHALILLRRHVASYFDLTCDEAMAINEQSGRLRDDILASDSGVEGFNIGVNIGAVAGQTIFHCHLHLIPRRHGDVPDPWGGVRAIIAGKARYQAEPVVR